MRQGRRNERRKERTDRKRGEPSQPPLALVVGAVAIGMFCGAMIAPDPDAPAPVVATSGIGDFTP